MESKIANEQHIKNKIINARKNIRAKYIALKRGEQVLQQNLQTLYKPIIGPINKMVNAVEKKDETYIKDEFGLKNESATFNFKNEVGVEDEGVDHAEASSLVPNEKRLDIDTINSSDYGIRRMRDGSLKIGSKNISLNDENINVDGKNFKLTKGLYELLSHVKPENFDANDLKIYKDILVFSNAHRVNFKNYSKIRRGNSYKYRNIIAKLFNEGNGIVYHNLKHPKVVYFNNINKLISRLRLLNAEKLAGNLSVESEIISILSKLRELDIIE